MPGLHGGVLRASGACAFCDARTEETCSICGRAICADHRVEGELVCIECASDADED